MTSDPVERYLLRAAKLGRRARLRPMPLSETFDLALRVYRTLGWTILGASALPTVLTLAGLSFLSLHVIPGFAWTRHGARESAQVADAALNFALGTLVAFPLVLIGVSLTTTFVAPLVADFMLGNVPNARAAREAQWRSAPRMLIVSLRESLLASSGALIGGALLLLSWFLDKVMPPGNATAGVVLVVGSLSLAVGGFVALYVLSAHALVSPVAVLENVSAGVAARRSKELMKARAYHGSGYDAVWSVYLLVAFIAGSLGAGVAAVYALAGVKNWTDAIGVHPVRPLIETAMGLAPVYLILWIVVPVWAVTVTIIYFERRVRLEGYDIEALASDVWRADREGRFQL